LQAADILDSATGRTSCRSTTRTVFFHVVFLIVGVLTESPSDGRFRIVAVRHISEYRFTDGEAGSQPELTKQLHSVVFLLYIVDDVRHLILMPQLLPVLFGSSKENGRTIHGSKRR